MPRPCARALDVGCGEGVVARDLRRRADYVAAIDVDPRSLELAREQDPDGEIDFRQGDFLQTPYEPASFDFVACVTALHHMDPGTALLRMAALVRPGGTVAVLGLARSVYPADLPRDAVASLVSRVYRARRGMWNSPAPRVWPPPHTYSEIRDLATATLPGARFHRHLLWRYSIVWTKPSRGRRRR